MKLTHHAKARMQQRSIPPLFSEWLDTFGMEQAAPYGGSILYFDKEAKRQVRELVGEILYKKIKPQLNIYKVVRNGLAITMGRRYKKIRRIK